jgi:hypothetical protein
MGFAAVEKALRYFLLGAVIVFPIWLVMRVLRMLGRSTGSDIAESGNHQA